MIAADRLRGWSAFSVLEIILQKSYFASYQIRQKLEGFGAHKLLTNRNTASRTRVFLRNMQNGNDYTLISLVSM